VTAEEGLPEPVPQPPRLRTALGWNATLNIGRRLTTTLVALVLAGVLGPQAFGTVAIATIYVLLLQLVFQQGFAPAIIQLEDLDERVLDTAFRLVLVGSAVLFAVGVGSSGLLAELFGDDDLTLIVSLLCLQLPLQALGIVQESVLRRRSDFRALSFRTNLAVVAGGIVGLATAFGGGGAFALVAQQLTTVALATALVWRQVAWRPSLRRPVSMRSATARELTGFARHVSIASVAQFGGGQIDSLLVGGFLGTTAAGLYRMGGRLVETALDLSVRTFQTTFQPDLVRHRRTEAFVPRVLRQHRTMCSLAMPPLGILAGSSTALVALLGAEWSSAAAPLAILAVGSTGIVFSSITTPVLQAIDAARALARLQISSAVILAVFLAVVTTSYNGSDVDGLEPVALWRGLLYSTVLAVLHIAVLKRLAHVPPTALVMNVVPGLLGTAAAAATGLLLSSSVERAVPAIPAAAVVCCAGALAGAFVVLALDPDARALARDVRRRVRRDPRAT
jgi:O-antigen/teichoic acid export membrane protein